MTTFTWTFYQMGTQDIWNFQNDILNSLSSATGIDVSQFHIQRYQQAGDNTIVTFYVEDSGFQWSTTYSDAFEANLLMIDGFNYTQLPSNFFFF